MPKKSAGLLLYRKKGGLLEVLLVHPGGPLWAKKDDGAWSIPKGELHENEDLLEAGKREFWEETGLVAEGECRPLKPCQQAGGKVFYAWAIRGDADAAMAKSNTFRMEWPPRSGKMQEFPEIDRAEWFEIGSAKRKILKGQQPLLEELEEAKAWHG
jgi:predicted NUDIX family NTP pyrophosphohydrolase